MKAIKIGGDRLFNLTHFISVLSGDWREKASVSAFMCHLFSLLVEVAASPSRRPQLMFTFTNVWMDSLSSWEEVALAARNLVLISGFFIWPKGESERRHVVLIPLLAAVQFNERHQTLRGLSVTDSEEPNRQKKTRGCGCWYDISPLCFHFNPTIKHC